MSKFRRTIFTFLIASLMLCETVCALEFTQGIPNGLGGSILLSQPSLFSLGALSNAGLGPREAALTFGGNRKFDLKELDQYLLSGAIRYDRWQLGLSLSSFGDRDLYSEQAGKLIAALHVRSFSFGLTGSGMMMRFGESFGDLSVWTCGLVGGWRSKYLLVAASVDNLNEPEPSQRSVPYRRLYAAYAEFRQSERYSLTGRIQASAEKTEFGFGQRLMLSRYGELLLGVSTEPFQYGGGVNLLLERFTLTYAVSYHPDLGLSHTVSLLTRFHLK